MKRFWVAVAVVLVVIAAFAIGLRLYLPVPHNSSRYTAQDWTVYAQVFGGIVGTLVAALAFAGLIYTALMQREELSLQREELKGAREAWERTASAQEASEKALRAQVYAALVAAQLNALSATLNSFTQQQFSENQSAELREKMNQNRKDIHNEIARLRKEVRDKAQADAKE